MDQTQLAHNVVLTFIQRYLDVLNVRWTLKQRYVPAGKVNTKGERAPQSIRKKLPYYDTLVAENRTVPRHSRIKLFH